MKIRITKKKRIIISVVVGILVFTIGTIVSHYLVEQAAQKQALIKAQMKLAEEYAAEYDYDVAIALLQELPDRDTNEEISNAIEKYEMLQLKQKLDVYLVDVTTSETETDAGATNYKFIWECVFENGTDKSVKSLEVIVVLTDMHGEKIKSAKCKFAEAGVKAGEKSTEVFSVEIGAEDMGLETLLVEEIEFDYYINSVVYEDGTKVAFDVYKGSAEKANKEEDALGLFE